MRTIGANAGGQPGSRERQGIYWKARSRAALRQMGYIGTEGATAIPLTYDEAGDFLPGLAHSDPMAICAGWVMTAQSPGVRRPTPP